MKAKDIKGIAVVALGEANKVGTVEAILFDAQFRTVVGFRLEHDSHHATPSILRSNVQAVGHDAITVSSRDALVDFAQHPELQTAIPLEQIVGTKVVSDHGDVLGTIDDVEIDDTAQAVQAYLLAMSLLERLGQQQHKILVDRVIQVGTGGLMTVTSTSTE